MDIQVFIDNLETAKRKGDLDGQIKIWRELLSFSQQNVNVVGEIEALRQLGNLYQAKGQLQKAHAYRLTAVEQAEDPQSNCPPNIYMLVVGDLGRSFIDTKDWSKGESYTQRALEMATAENDLLAECIYKINLQLVLGNTGRESQALKLAEDVFRDSAVLLNEPQGHKNYTLALQHLNLAAYQLSQYHLNECQRHARKALAHAERAQNPFLQLRAQQILGKSYVRARLLIGNPEYSAEAEKHLYEAIKNGQRGSDSWIEAEAEAELGLLYEHRRNSDNALGHYQRALDLLETVRSGLGYEEFQIAYFRSVQRIYENAAEYFLKQEKMGLAFHTLERLRSRLLLAHMGEKRVNSKTWSPEDQEQLNNALDGYGSQAIRQIYGDGTRGKQHGITLGVRAVWRGEPTEITPSEVNEAQREFVRLYDIQRAHQINWITNELPSAIHLDEAQSLLGAEDALLAYWATKRNLVVFALTQNSCHFQHLAYPVERLERDVEEIIRQIYILQSRVLDPLVADEWFARSISDPWPTEIAESMESLGQMMKRVYALLIAPLLSVIGEYKHWVIIPNGPLHQLPWAALRTPQRYLVEEHSLSLLPSASVGMVLKERLPIENGEAIFLADPDPENWQLALPASQIEVHAAYEALKAKIKPLVGPDATKTNLLANLANIHLLHLACHNVFNASAPLLSFLKLAGSKGTDYLYAFEISELNLSAELVSLSACQSGRSRTETGDEQYGIVRAFLAAGAQSVISTLWSIEDKSAAAFFTHFYQLARHYSLSEALRRAQIALLEDPHYCLPSFWAPYALSGRWNRPLGLSHRP